MRRTAVGVLLGALALTSCTSTGDGPGAGATGSKGPAQGASSAGASSSPSASSSAAGTETPRTAPPVGGCYDLGLKEVASPTSDQAPVACREEHTTQTIHVGRLQTVVSGHLVAVDSRAAQEQMQRVCSRRLARYVGGTPRTRALSRLTVVWFGPTAAESDQGATWFRCDVVALQGKERLAPLPPPRRLQGVLDRPRALDSFGLCGTSAPGSPGFARVICAQPHRWRAVTTINLPGGRRYPGAAAVRRGGESACRNLVSRQQGNADTFRYGWEWPSREQWEAGQTYGYCWAPD